MLDIDPLLKNYLLYINMINNFAIGPSNNYTLVSLLSVHHTYQPIQSDVCAIKMSPEDLKMLF
jgi:hypothetical protein